MIYVNQEQLDQVKYLLEQSALGNHLLFDRNTIQRLGTDAPPAGERSERVERAEKLLEQMILRPTLAGKLDFLASLETATRDDVARVYFNIVQNTAQEHQGFSH